MSHHNPGPVGTLIIVLGVTVVSLFDRRRRLRAERLNQEGRCARCGEMMFEPAGRVQISGGPYFPKRAYVCASCLSTVRMQERLFWWFMGFTLLFLMGLLIWQKQHP